MKVSELQLDALRELLNIGVGQAAGSLNEMLNAHISLQVPYIKVLSPQQLEGEVPEVADESLAIVRLGFQGEALSGSAAIVFPPDSAAKLVSILVGEEEDVPDLDEIRAGTLSEVGNIVVNSVMGAISNLLEQNFDYALPVFSEDRLGGFLGAEGTDAEMTILLVQTHFDVQEFEINGNVLVLFEARSMETLLASIDQMLDGKDA